MEITALNKDTPLWEKTLLLARNCSWKAGASLASLMKNNCFRDWERVFAAVENGEAVGFCTLTRFDSLPENCGYSPFIGYVFVDEKYRGRHISFTMIESVCAYAGSLGFKTVYICSSEVGLYEKSGFTKSMRLPTIYGTTEQLFFRKV